MDSKKTKDITVSMGISRSNNDIVLLQIDDDVSGDSILDVEMSLESYALLLTNLWGVKAGGVLYDTQNAGKKRVIKQVHMPSIDSINKDEIGLAVREHFEDNYADLGWKIKDDGLRSQQNLPQKHKYVLVKYVEVNDSE